MFNKICSLPGFSKNGVFTTKRGTVYAVITQSQDLKEQTKALNKFVRSQTISDLFKRLRSLFK